MDAVAWHTVARSIKVMGIESSSSWIYNLLPEFKKCTRPYHVPY
jgi:hypothetical protein